VIRDETMQFDFGIETPARKDGTSRTASLAKRQAALWSLRQTLKLLEEEERRTLMAKIRSVFAGRDCPSLGRAMTGQEVRALVADGLVTVGAHSVTHPVLTELGAAACYQEISGSKFACEEIIGASVASFAYPYGDFDTKAREAVKTAGFSFACSARYGPVIPASDILALPRVHVLNWCGDAFEQALRFASAAG
jgi:hypothetical protein